MAKRALLISLAEIIDLVEGLNILGTCIMEFKKCAFKHTCAMHEVWEETRTSILKVLNNTSLDQLKNPRSQKNIR